MGGHCSVYPLVVYVLTGVLVLCSDDVVSMPCCVLSISTHVSIWSGVDISRVVISYC